jgi:hypothetical protein
MLTCGAGLTEATSKAGAAFAPCPKALVETKSKADTIGMIDIFIEET